LGRIICLDIGEKRIGIAVSDPLFITAQGLETYNRSEEEKDIAYIAGKMASVGADRLLLGLPLNMNGTAGPQAEKVMAFAKTLEEKTGVKAEFQDERLTTRAAEQILLQADLSRAKRKKVIDKMAAVQILQSYLDSHG
jgi:putative Holliday junction resolvase